MAAYCNLFIYSNISFIGLLNLCSRYTLFERTMFQAVIFADKFSKFSQASRKSEKIRLGD